MGMKIIMTVCMLPILLILYGVMWFCTGEKDRMQFGVTLWKGARDSAEVQKVRKIYRRELNGYAACCFLLFILTLIPKHESLVFTGQMIWMFFVLVVMFVPFARANRRLLEQKREYQASLPEEQQKPAEDALWVDVTAAGISKPKLFRKSLYAGMAFAVLPAVLEPFLYHVQDRPQAPELWVSEITLLLIAAVTMIFPLWIRYYETQRTTVLTGNSQINIQLARVRQYQWSRFGMLMVWGTGVFNWGILCAFHVPEKNFLWIILAVSLIFTLWSIGFSLRCWYVIHKTSEKYLQQEKPFDEDGDEHWLWGIFYYNKNDKRSMVDKRAGVGVTCNMAKPGIKYGSIIFIVVFAVYIIGMCAWVVAEDFTMVSLNFSEGILTADHWKEEYHIEEKQIKSVELLETLPEMSKRKGTGMETVKKGNFYSSEYERNFQVCLNPREAPFLMVETKKGTWYLLGGSDGGQTREIYRALAEMIRHG